MDNGKCSQAETMMDIGECPTGQHKSDFRQCGFTGAIDLRPWANAHRYRWRLEQSYRAENNAHVKGDGRWFVEVLCKYGLIYAAGGIDALVYGTRGVVAKLRKIEPLKHHQYDSSAEVFRFPITAIDEVAAIVRPRRRRPPIVLSPERLRAMQECRKTKAQVGQSNA